MSEIKEPKKPVSAGVVTEKKAPRAVIKFADTAKITKIGEAPKYRENSKRGKMFSSIKDGMTVKEFMDLNGGRAVASTYLTWFANSAKVVKVA